MFCNHCGARQPEGARFCSGCGQPLTAAPAQRVTESGNDPHQLPEGTVLRGRYRIGKVLGQGGFGITYLGTDILMETQVAVKEFFPSAIVSRNCFHSLDVTCHSQNMNERYQASKDRFFREARALVRFRNIPEVVNILDFVEENNTGYIVMEYVQGMSLAKYLAVKGGRLTAPETFAILKPVMKALAEVHKAGIVHRDIAPDNIILHPLGGAKILDFGAVRQVENPDADTPLAKSTEAILKQGFAPIEQYNSRGSLGPWSDVYALCATVYYCLSGLIPPDASSRIAEGVEPDWDAVPGLGENQVAALKKGMALRARDRYPDMEQLMADLFREPVLPGKELPAPPEEPREPKPQVSEAPQPDHNEETEKRPNHFWGFLMLLLAVCAIVGGILDINRSFSPYQGPVDSALLLQDVYSDFNPCVVGMYVPGPESALQNASSNSASLVMDLWMELGTWWVREMSPAEDQAAWDMLFEQYDVLVEFGNEDWSSCVSIRISRDGRMIVTTQTEAFRCFTLKEDQSSLYEAVMNWIPQEAIVQLDSFIAADIDWKWVLLETKDWSNGEEPVHRAYDISEPEVIEEIIRTLGSQQVQHEEIYREEFTGMETDVCLHGADGEFVLFNVTDDGALAVSWGDWWLLFGGAEQIYAEMQRFLPEA